MLNFVVLAEKAGEGYQSSRQQPFEMTTTSSLPMEEVDMEPELTNPYSPPRQKSMKQDGQNSRGPRSYSTQSLYYSSISAASPGALRPWQSKDTLGHRQSYGPKKLSTIEKELHNSRYMPPQPYFVTNSKTEVTVWGSAPHEFALKDMNWWLCVAEQETQTKVWVVSTRNR